MCHLEIFHNEARITRQDETAMERSSRGDTTRCTAVLRALRRAFLPPHIIWQRYNNRAMHGALRDSLIEIWMNRVSKSDGNNSIGNRRSMLDRAKADRRSTRCGTPCFVSKHTGSRSLQNWIAPLFEDEKMRNNMPLSSQILSSRKDRIRFVKRGIFFLSFRTIVDEIQRLVHSIRRYSKNVGKKCERQWPSLFILLLFISLMALR